MRPSQSLQIQLALSHLLVLLLAVGVTVAVVGDSRRIHQVLKNLIHNAIDHNPSGTNVWASCCSLGDQVVYSVEDDGPLIPVGDQDAIFDRFTKLDPSRPRGLSGGGLGLSIVREILKAHQSEIVLHDTPHGKAFSFRLRRPRIGNESSEPSL